MAEHMARTPEDAVEAANKKTRFQRVRTVARWTGAVVASGLVIAGGALLARNNNWKDLADLSQYTSPEHQDDRCNTQAAADAQQKSHDFFAEQGGITPEQAAAMAPVVGLEAEELQNLINVELFPLDYDCEVPRASTNEGTMGLIAIAGGAGAGVAVGAGAAGRALSRRFGAAA